MPERPCAYDVLRYIPNLVRDEWVNIGVLLFDPAGRARRLRLIEEQEEYARVKRVHPYADEALLRGLRDEFEKEFAAQNGGFLEVVEKLNQTLSNALQLSQQKGVLTEDLDTEVERLYADHVALPSREGDSAVRTPIGRGPIRRHCGQVFRQARVWEKIEKSVPVGEFTFPGDPLRLDYAYRRNGTRGFVHALSVAREPSLAKILAYTAGRMRGKMASAEFAAVTDVPLAPTNDRHRFVAETLKDQGIEAVPVDSFAVWVDKLRPLLR
jgi:hypothetical protein